MRDRTKEMNMLKDTIKIFAQGYYEKNGKKIKLKLSKEKREEKR